MEEVSVSRARTRATMRVDKEQKSFSMPEMIETRHSLVDTVATIMYWIIWDLADAMKDIDIAPPIQSRMYQERAAEAAERREVAGSWISAATLSHEQVERFVMLCGSGQCEQELSNGMLGFNNCLKIADVPFPLPFAQLLGMLLVAFSAFIPIYVIVFTRSPIAGPILCFLLFESLWCLNEVAKELENPFGHDSNDITLSEPRRPQKCDFHLNFVDSLEDISMAEQQVLLHMPIVLPEESLPNCSEEVPSEVFIISQKISGGADGDILLCVLGFGMLYNHAKLLAQASGKQCEGTANLSYALRTPPEDARDDGDAGVCVHFAAARAIKEGEELLIDYSERYARSD
eukprot:s128_g33.t1